MRIDEATLSHLQEWIGKSERYPDQVTAAPYRALSATPDINCHLCHCFISPDSFEVGSDFDYWALRRIKPFTGSQWSFVFIDIDR